MLYRDPETTMEKLNRIKEALNIHCKTSSLKDNPFELNLVLDKYNGMFIDIGEDIYCFQKLKELLREYLNTFNDLAEGKQELPSNLTQEQVVALKDLLTLLSSSISSAQQKYYTEQVH